MQSVCKTDTTADVGGAARKCCSAPLTAKSRCFRLVLDGFNRDDLDAIMSHFAEALGGDDGHCHEVRTGKGTFNLDLPLERHDPRQPKLTDIPSRH